MCNKVALIQNQKYVGKSRNKLVKYKFRGKVNVLGKFRVENGRLSENMFGRTLERHAEHSVFLRT